MMFLVHHFSWPIGIQLFLRQLLAFADIGSIVFEFYILKILPKHVCKGGKTVLFICVLMSDSAFFQDCLVINVGFDCIDVLQIPILSKEFSSPLQLSLGQYVVKGDQTQKSFPCKKCKPNRIVRTLIVLYSWQNSGQKLET